MERLATGWPIALAVAASISLAGPAAAQAPPQREVTVATVEELVRAMEPDTSILLESGTYNLSRVANVRTQYLSWKEVFDGVEPVFTNLKNLTLRGKGDVRILIGPRYAWVLNFTNSHGITLANLTIGHTDAGTCVGGVVRFAKSRDVALDRVVLFGSGTIGVELDQVDHFDMKASVVRKCTYGLLTILKSRGVHFTDSVFEETEGFDFIHVAASEGVEFSGCDFRNNEGDRFFFLEPGPNGGTVLLKDCKVHQNQVGRFTNALRGLKLTGVTFEGNRFSDHPDAELNKGGKP